VENNQDFSIESIYNIDEKIWIVINEHTLTSWSWCS